MRVSYKVQLNKENNGAIGFVIVLLVSSFIYNFRIRVHIASAPTVSKLVMRYRWGRDISPALQNLLQHSKIVSGSSKIVSDTKSEGLVSRVWVWESWDVIYWSKCRARGSRWHGGPDTDTDPEHRPIWTGLILAYTDTDSRPGLPVVIGGDIQMYC